MSGETFGFGSSTTRPWSALPLSLMMTVAACLTVALAPTLAGPVDIPGWDLVFQDEFDVGPPNTSEWDVLNRQDSFNNELQYYRQEQVTVSGGNLVITATDQPLGPKDYRSGLVRTWDEWSYGRFEARINLPTTQGMWPAFWLLPRTAAWPSGGEIDIMENEGSRPGVVSSAYHWGPDFFGRDFIFDEYSGGGQPANFHDSFHDYAVEWEPGVLRFYVDGNNYHTITENSTGVVLGNQAEIFDTPKSIILNLAVGGDFGGDPDGSTVFPQEMLIDYVRVWQRPDNPGTGENLLSNPGFDDGGGSLDDWSVFGNSIANVSANDQLANDGTHALKNYGQFNGPDNLSGVSQGAAISAGASLRAEASTLTPSWDTLFGKDNDVTMKIEFYSVFGADSESNNFLGEVSQLIHDGSSAADIWLDHALEAVAPQAAVEARLSFVFRQRNNDNGAIWIDSAGLFLNSIIAGDFDADGFVSQPDLDLVLLSWGQDASVTGVPAGWVNQQPTGLIGQATLDEVLINWGDSTPPLLSAVPEPATAALLVAAVGVLAARRRPLQR